MKMLTFAGLLILLAACGGSGKTDDPDTREAARLDSLTGEIDRAGAELESIIDSTSGAVDDLLRGI